MAELVTLNGLKETQKIMGSMIRFLEDDTQLNEYYNIAVGLRDKIRSAAKRGLTGNLKRGIMAKKFRRQTRNNPAVFVAPHYRIAPHARLVEYGHRLIAWGHPTNRMVPPHPFWRPTIDANKESIQRQLSNICWERIRRTWRS